MRTDMLKVVTEPGRRGGGQSIHNEYRLAKKFKLDENLEVNDEYCHTVLPMRCKRLGWDGKVRSYNTNPVNRFLRSNVGKKWDDVYSEICKVFKYDHKVGYSACREFLTWCVEETYLADDGVVYARSWRGSSPIEESHDTLYIDPRDGILKLSTGESYKARNKRRRAEKQAAEAVDPDSYDIKDVAGSVIERLRRIDGTWFRVWDEDVTHWDGHRRTVLTKKQTLSKAELKSYKLI